MLGRRRHDAEATSAQAASAYAVSAALLFGLVETGKLTREEAETVLRTALRILGEAPMGLRLPAGAAERGQQNVVNLLQMLFDDRPE